MACKAHSMSPFHGFFDAMGIDRDLMDAGVLNMYDYAEDFLSRLGRADSGHPSSGHPNPQHVLAELFKQFGGQRAEADQQSPKQFQFEVNVNGYQPNDLRIRVENGFLIVSGKYEHRAEDGSSWETRQFERKTKLDDD